MGVAKLGQSLEDAAEVTDNLFDAVEHIAPKLIWYNETDSDRAILATDLAKLTTNWINWLEIVKARIAGQQVKWQWVNTGLSEGEELILREI